MNRVIALSGPTASGKTGWGIKLARSLNGAVICADSRTVYRELDIGAGKVTTEFPATWRTSDHGPVATVEGVDHYGLNLVGLDEVFTVVQFYRFVAQLLPQLWREGKQPIILGGTGLYLNAVLDGYTFSGRGGNKKQEPVWPKKVFVIDRPREELYRRIDERVDERMNEGMLAEVQALIAAGHADRLLRLGLEYRVLTKYLLGEQSPQRLAEATVRLKGEIHAYARRQLTWWRHHQAVDWISSYTEVERKSREFLSS